MKGTTAPNRGKKTMRPGRHKGRELSRLPNWGLSLYTWGDLVKAKYMDLRGVRIYWKTQKGESAGPRKKNTLRYGGADQLLGKKKTL